MAERSQLWTTGTTGDGVAAGYTEAQSIEFFRDMLTPFVSAGPHTSQGVLRGVLGDLAVLSGSGQVSVAAGAAFVEGYYYKNDSNLAVAIPTPAANTRIDRIVLRVNHSARTTRITRIVGTEGAPAPALTQVAGTTWDIPLAQIGITTAGVITVTDQRSCCYFATKVSTAMLDDGANTNAKIANDAVDDTKVGARVPQLIRRQGGNAANWATIGTATYTPDAVRMQVGRINDGAASATSFTVTFPIAYSAIPVVFVQSGDFNAGAVIGINNVTTTGFVANVINKSLSNAMGHYWLAIGPE
jgi:hypothetical protein